MYKLLTLRGREIMNILAELLDNSCGQLVLKRMLLLLFP